VPDEAGRFRLEGDGKPLVAQPIPMAAASAPTGPCEHLTFAPAGIFEISPLPPQ
jgi:hypothetical protein